MTTEGDVHFHDWIGDVDFNVSKLYGMLPASTEGDPTKRTPADNQTVRNVFVIGPDKKVIIAESVSDDEAREKYPDGWDSPRPYIRIVPQPE